MNKNISKVRKSIAKRKKDREVHLGEKNIFQNRDISVFPEDEEKHGYYPIFTGSKMKKDDQDLAIPSIIFKGILSIILFFGVALLWQTDNENLSTLKGWSSYALTEEFPFAKVNKWYVETFGNPMGYNQGATVTNDIKIQALPVNGNVKESFQVNGKGIMIAADDTKNVTAMQDGIVLFAGNDRKTKKTVIVQHADGSETTYGYLNSLDVHLYQAVRSNQILGKFSPNHENEMFYFSIEKNNEYIDPIQVIQVDENQ